jgi:hypothetical protein
MPGDDSAVLVATVGAFPTVGLCIRPGAIKWKWKPYPNSMK